MQSVSSDYFDYYFGWENSRLMQYVRYCTRMCYYYYYYYY